ncbi:X-ray repair cross-complementing protein 5, partial [Melipona quadrifasciata]
ESLILLINIGVTNSNTENNHSTLEKAKEIAKRKIEKMIFLSPKDEIAIMLMGSSVTKNNLNTQHVEEFTDFQIPNWDFVKKCMALEGTNYCSNWVEALVAAVEFMEKNVVDDSTRKIILMSDFNEDPDIISQFQVDAIADRLSTKNIKLITISQPSTSLTISQKFLKDVHKKINGQHTTFDKVLSDLKFYIPSKKPCPYYYTLELLDKIIHVTSYTKIDIEKFPFWKTESKNNEYFEKKTEYLNRQRVSYSKDEIVKGYKYGETFIPVERNNIDLEYLYKSVTHILLPTKESENVTKPFYSLVFAMQKTNSVAIVRKVFENNPPRMVALFPCIDIPDEPWCLVEIELVYAEDRRVLETRPMKSVIKQLLEEQNEAVDSLINSLMLSDTQDTCEIDGSQYFLPGYVPNPAVQHKWHILSHRAINPDKPLPPMENYLKEILEVSSVKERSKFHLQKIVKLFRLESIDPKKEKNEIKEQDNMQLDNNIDTEESNKIEDIAENNYKESEVPSLDTSDIDFDEMVKTRNISLYVHIYIFEYLFNIFLFQAANI